MLEQITAVVRQAGDLLQGAHASRDEIREKTGPRDLVTKYDVQLQALLQTRLTALLPGAGFLGEEGFAAGRWQDYEWLFVVDPIDGTTNFIQGYRNSCVSVGLLHWGRPEYAVVYNPFDGELYTARRGCGAWLNGRPLQAPDRDLEHSLLLFGSGSYYRELVPESLRIFNAAFPLVQDVRRFGSAALDLCYLAAGRAGVFYECRLCPWDYAAGSLIAEQAGVLVTQLDGSALNLYDKGSVLAGVPTAYRALKACIEKGADR